MINPFTTIADELKGEVIERWLNSKAIENAPSGWDIVQYNDEWNIYTIGKVKELGRVAGFRIEIEGIDLNALLSSNTAIEMFEDEWIKKTKDLDEVYLGLVLDYISSLGLQPEDFIKITK